MPRQSTNRYRSQEILAGTPCQLVAKLYEGAIAALRQAADAIERNDVEGRWRANRKAFDIIEHLAGTLDMERGGEIAANLDRLYHYMLRRLIEVDVRNDRKAAEDVIGLLEPLYRAWQELDRRLLAAQSRKEAAREGRTEPRTGPGTNRAPGRVLARA